jgi:hypothetical protein
MKGFCPEEDTCDLSTSCPWCYKRIMKKAPRGLVHVKFAPIILRSRELSISESRHRAPSAKLLLFSDLSSQLPSLVRLSSSKSSSSIVLLILPHTNSLSARYIKMGDNELHVLIVGAGKSRLLLQQEQAIII